jgi:hypothetical protein
MVILRVRQRAQFGPIARILCLCVLMAASSVVAASPAVALGSVSIVGTASGNTIVGLQVFDNVNLNGGTNPTGTVTFKLFGPGDVNCSASIFTSTVNINGTGSYNSAHFTTIQAGTYQWEAAYSGDANNNPTGPTTCTVASESVIVDKANTGLSTIASPSVPVGGSIHDTAMLGGFNPTGTISFRLSGPADTFCGSTPVFTATVAVTAGAGNYPSPSFTPTAPGTYRWQAGYSGDVNNGPVSRTACLDANESVAVTQGTTAPSISTTASPSVTVGGTVNDTATLSAGNNPTGSITFTLFGPNDTACTATPAFSSVVSVTGNGSYSSGPFTTASPGTYRWTAGYGGDAGNSAVVSGCGAANESVVVTKATAAVASLASAPVTVGSGIGDTATLSGGVNPTGTIAFSLFGPNNATCSGSPVFTSTVAVSAGNGSYGSGLFAATLAGTYRFVAAYRGDANNGAVSSACGAPNGTVVVSPAVTAIVTHASAGVAAGGGIGDTATLSGGVNPAGTIAFSLFGPNNATCSGSPVFTSTVAVSGNGSYGSGSFTASAAGTYRFVAAYSGDANNWAAVGACSDPGESVVVGAAGPAVTTQASPGTTVGGTVGDTAQLTGGVGPTGTITFSLFGPNNATCSGSPVFTSTVAVSAGNGSYGSGLFAATLAGTYRFVAAYSGDANNKAARPTGCTDPKETVNVAPSATSISTAATAQADVGQPISDTATLVAGAGATGTITFELFGPNNATCTGAPVLVSATKVTGGGTYPSARFTPTAPGIYHFEASYSGDANNATIPFTACGAPGENANVNPAATSTTVTAAPNPSMFGQPVTVTATLTAGEGGGTVSFFADGNSTAVSGCASVPLSAGGAYHAGCTASSLGAGNHVITASYSGDVAYRASAGTLSGGQSVDQAPSITSGPGTTFMVGGAGSFPVTATGFPAPGVTGTGTLPSGVTFDSARATLAGTPAPGTVGTYPITFLAANGIGAGSTQSFTLTVNQAPAVTSAPSATFTVGVAGSFPVTATGVPTPKVTETGSLPSGVTFDGASQTLTGTPGQGTAGIYPVSFAATNGASTTQSFTLTVNQATMTYPTDGLLNVDTTRPFTWSTIPQAQAYLLVVGTTLTAADLLNTGILSPTLSSLNVPALPVGPTLFATLFSQVNGAWTSHQTIAFTAAPGQADFTYPRGGQTGSDPTRPFTWSTVPGAQGYMLVVGLLPYGSDIVNSGPLPPAQSSYSAAALPPGIALYATLLTKVNGSYSRYRAITFVAGPARGSLLFPVNGQLNVATPTAFTWSTVAGAQNYYLTIGTTLYGTQLVNSGTLAPTQSSYPVPRLPPVTLLYATLLTKVNGSWAYQVIVFTAA